MKEPQFKIALVSTVVSIFLVTAHITHAEPIDCNAQNSKLLLAKNNDRTYGESLRELREIFEAAGPAHQKKIKKYYEAVLNALEAFRKAGLKAPIIYDPLAQTRTEIAAKDWYEKIVDTQDQWPRYGTVTAPLELTRAENRKIEVYSFISMGRKKIFRSFRTLGGTSDTPVNFSLVHKVRLTLAASVHNSLYGWNSVPYSELAVVNGQAGLVSDFAPGAFIKNLKNKKLNPIGQATAQVAEFYNGNGDAHDENFYIDADGIPRVYDHDGAFHIGILGITDLGPHNWSKDELRFGWVFPAKYPPLVADALKSITREQVRAAMSVHLTAAELDSLLFRREILIQDLLRRKKSALFK